MSFILFGEIPKIREKKNQIFCSVAKKHKTHHIVTVVVEPKINIKSFIAIQTERIANFCFFYSCPPLVDPSSLFSKTSYSDPQ